MEYYPPIPDERTFNNPPQKEETLQTRLSPDKETKSDHPNLFSDSSNNGATAPVQTASAFQNIFKVAWLPLYHINCVQPSCRSPIITGQQLSLGKPLECSTTIASLIATTYEYSLIDTIGNQLAMHTEKQSSKQNEFVEYNAVSYPRHTPKSSFTIAFDKSFCVLHMIVKEMAQVMHLITSQLNSFSLLQANTNPPEVSHQSQRDKLGEVEMT